MKKIKKISFKVSEEDYDEIINKAEENHMSLSRYIRDMLLIERNSFKFKVLKTVSFCLGILMQLRNKNFNEKEKAHITQTIDKILTINGLDLQDIRDQDEIYDELYVEYEDEEDEEEYDEDDEEYDEEEEDEEGEYDDED